MQFGEFNITGYNFGTFRLDGGAMFGSVPKNLWSRLIPADDENCIPLATRTLIVRHRDKVIITDVGCGHKWADKPKKIFAIETKAEEDFPIPFDAVTDIVLTHLHFDHAGGLSRHNAAGELEPCFPNATLHVQRENYENAKKPGPRERGSYLAENVGILEKMELNLCDGETEVLPNIHVHPIHGHTRGQQWIEFVSGSERLAYVADLVPTSHHLPIPYNMGYDICPETILKEKEAVLEKAVNENWTIAFAHDPKIAAVKVGKSEKGHYCVKEEVSLE